MIWIPYKGEGIRVWEETRETDVRRGIGDKEERKEK
jgi:hypothetical protein